MIAVVLAADGEDDREVTRSGCLVRTKVQRAHRSIGQRGICRAVSRRRGVIDKRTTSRDCSRGKRQVAEVRETRTRRGIGVSRSHAAINQCTAASRIVRAGNFVGSRI
jgi:hypothetical protein